MSDPSFNPVTGYSVAYGNSSEPGQFAVDTTTIGPAVSMLSGDGSFNLAQSPNVLGALTQCLSGNLFAFEGTGGYYTAQTFADINALAQTVVQTFDSTGSLEIHIPVATFNAKLGTYDSVAAAWTNDNLSLTATEFVSNLTDATQVKSVGKLSTLYSDFTAYVKNYFGIHATGPLEGFGTLFSGDFNFNPNGGVFGPTDFYNLVHANVSLISDSSYITPLSGVVDLSNINQTLRNAVSANPFGNRDPSLNYGVSTGFLPGDLMFIPANGISITMNLVVEPETFPTPLNNYNVNVTGGNNQDASFTTSSSSTGTANQTSWNNTSSFTQNTNASTVLISRVVTAPLLMIMA